MKTPTLRYEVSCCNRSCRKAEEFDFTYEEACRAALFGSCRFCKGNIAVVRLCDPSCSPKYGRDDHEGFHMNGCPNIGNRGEWDR